jgi:uncharacterized ferritin-like protein (DUF455 family)
MQESEENLFESAHKCLMIKDPYQKADEAKRLYQAFEKNEIVIQHFDAPDSVSVPGRPLRPVLVHPRDVPKRGFKSRQGLLRLAHAVAHIEFNAINLALDAVYRFRNMPQEFYSDWLKIAAEEAKHFLLLDEYLRNHGSFYGEYEAHNGLWEMAIKTDHDVMIRMALVPRVLEARGLDVTPDMIDKLTAAGEWPFVDILKIIHEEEIGHVLSGTRWFNYECRKRALHPRETFINLLNQYMTGVTIGPFHEESRKQAGFTAEEMDDLLKTFVNKEVSA